MKGQRQVESVQALALILHGVRIGVLAHYSGGKNILTLRSAIPRFTGNAPPVVYSAAAGASGVS